MQFSNYRYYLSETPDSCNLKIASLLQNLDDLELIRVSTDFNSPKPSISLLCKTAKALNQPTQIAEIFARNGIQIEDIKTETLLEEELSPEDDCHDCHDHGHEHHDHGHGHGHEHHGHGHEHHGHGHEHHGHGDGHEHHGDGDHGHGHVHDNHWLKAGVGLFWGLGLLVMSLGGFTIPLTAYYAITGMTSLLTIYLGHNIYKSAWQGLFTNRWDTTTLYTISTLTILIVSLASLLIPGLPMMFEAAPFVLGFWHLGEGIEHSLIDKITEELDVRDCIHPVVLLQGEPEQEISVNFLIPNDVITIGQGNVIPVDGVLTQKALLYTSRIDGSPELKEFQPGDLVQSGMRLADHVPSVDMRVTKTYQNSYLSVIAKSINEAQQDKAPVEIFANQVLKYFIPGLLGIAVLSGIVISALFSPALAIQCVVTVLVSACPCALKLITPMGVRIGRNKAAEHGVQFRSGKDLEAAANINTIVLDLNGTLTKGIVKISSLKIDDERFLSHIAQLERHSEHAMAKILTSYLEENYELDSELEVDAIDKNHHSGIKGTIDGETFMVGNKDMLLANDITDFKLPYNNPVNGSLYIVRGKAIIGQIATSDELREDAIATVAQLKRLGKEVHICTGADLDTAEKYADQLGIDRNNICANTVAVLTNEDQISKTGYIRFLQNKGRKVAMVGDAANDIAAIAHSNLGVAVESKIGDTATQQHAGIIVQQGLLFHIATAFDIAEKTHRNIRQNLLISLTYNSLVTLAAAGLFVAIGLTLNPAVGVALMVLESTLVLSNLYRLKEQEIVTLESQQNAILEDEAVGNSTCSVLNLLNHCFQPENTSERTLVLSETHSHGGPLFRPPQTSSQLKQEQELVCSY